MASYRRSVYNGRRDATLYDNPRYVRDVPNYKSAPLGTFNPQAQARPTTNVYTGTYVTGIATMHKSNPVPVVAPIKTNPKLQ